MTNSLQLRGFATESDYEDSVMASLRPRLDLIVARLAESGAQLPDPDDLAEAMATAVPNTPTRSEYDRLLGPFYSSAGVMNLLGVPTKQALDDRRRRGTLLAARTSDDTWVYPAFQFDTKERTVRPALKPVLAALKTAPRWGAALWLVTELSELGGRCPLNAVEHGHDTSLVCRLAAEYAQAVSA
jgi:hypothetical protein